MRLSEQKHMPHRLLIVMTLVVGLGLNAAFAFKAGPAEFADEVKVGDTLLKLRGAGLKRFLTIQVVSVGLYLPEAIKATDVLTDCVKRLDVVYLQNIPKDELDRATIKGIKVNVSKDEWKALLPKIAEINNAYADVKKGDRISVSYLPNKGLEIYLNGTLRGTVQGADIAKAFFSIWVGEVPVDAKMKGILLGGQVHDEDD